MGSYCRTHRVSAYLDNCSYTQSNASTYADAIPHDSTTAYRHCHSYHHTNRYTERYTNTDSFPDPHAYPVSASDARADAYRYTRANSNSPTPLADSP